MGNPAEVLEFAFESTIPGASSVIRYLELGGIVVPVGFSSRETTMEFMDRVTENFQPLQSLSTLYEQSA